MKRLRGVLPRPAAVPSTLSTIPLVPSLSHVGLLRSNSTSATRLLSTSASSSLSFLESGIAPPTTRPNLVARLEARLEAEIHGNYAQANGVGHPSQGSSNSSAAQGSATTSAPLAWSIAVTSPYHFSSSPYGTVGVCPLSFTHPIALPETPVHPAGSPSDQAQPRERSRSRYHFDAGAYGIPKHRSSRVGSGRRKSEADFRELELAVSVGEDAYFIRENAMGVADGVGGWARCSDTRPSAQGPSASALFSRRLMHYCSAELVDGDPDLTTARGRREKTGRQPAATIRSRSTPARPLSPLRVYDSVYPTTEQLVNDLEDSLEELEDGLDVLAILEKAYESTLKAHVVPSLATSPQQPETQKEASKPKDGQSSAAIPKRPSSPGLTLTLSDSPTPVQKVKPLMAGSSTALVAVLDYVTEIPSSLTQYRDPLLNGQDQVVLRIAHLGDSMGMLIRGDEIVWRSTEMWSKFNTPYQLGPCSTMTPKDARIFTIPVEADDILILATDGLSDNLWDEEILDEVIRFRRSFLQSQTPASQEPTVKGDNDLTHQLRTLLGRKTLSGMLSEALCSRARRIAERGHGTKRTASPVATSNASESDNETPFARRARAHGRVFRGGKADDISVAVAVISPTF